MAYKLKWFSDKRGRWFPNTFYRVDQFLARIAFLEANKIAYYKVNEDGNPYDDPSVKIPQEVVERVSNQ